MPVTDGVRLLLLRHGEAERTAPSDELRALTASGRDEVARTARHIAALGLPAPVVVSSPYLRARETAAILAAILDVDPVRTVSRITPDDSPTRALAVIDPLCAAGSVVVVVTHMPLIGRLLGLLVEGDAFRAPGIATASGALLAGDLLAPGLLRIVGNIGPHA